MCERSNFKMSDVIKILEHLEKSVQALLLYAGEDPDREGLQETPVRFLNALKFWTDGYRQDPASIFKTFEDGSENYDQMVFQGNIPFWSLCEHHLAPFWGLAYVGYLPKGKIVGLSKLLRIVEVFARRITVQERITTQVANAIENHIETKGVGVVLRCRHACIESRGVCKPGSVTTTTVLRGVMKAESDARQEFLDYVSRDAQQQSP